MARMRKIPQRSCVACGRVRPKRELVRIVRTPAGEISIDRTGKVSGRGAYVCPELPCADRAMREGRLQHALAVVIPEAVADELRRLADLAAAGQRSTA